MSQENIYGRLQEMLERLNGNYNILEDQINIDIQMEYFEYSKKIKKKIDIITVLNSRDDLFSIDVALTDKKQLLSKLATIDNVDAFRSIEKYKSDPDPELKDWATLALQESRLLLESNLLDQNQVFISTGMGGRGNKLRYFVVFITKENKPFEDFSRKIFQSEVNYIFKKYDAEVETLNFSSKYATIKTLIPIPIQLNELFEDVVAECNQMGDFLETNFIITNVKELSNEEIEEVLIKSRDTDTGEEISEWDSI
jgi:hypothetical protein